MTPGHGRWDPPQDVTVLGAAQLLVLTASAASKANAVGGAARRGPSVCHDVGVGEVEAGEIVQPAAVQRVAPRQPQRPLSAVARRAGGVRR